MAKLFNAVLAILLFCATASAQISDGQFMDAIDSTVRISRPIDFGAKKIVGSGVILDETEDHYVVMTNRHVAGIVGVSNSIDCFNWGYKKKTVSSSTKDAWYRKKGAIDLAILHVSKKSLPGEMPVISLADSKSELKQGDRIITVGSSSGRWPRTRIGHVNKIQDGLIYYTPTSIPGDSGGPVFSADGKNVVGITAWYYRDRSGKQFGLAMSANRIRDIMAGKAKSIILPTSASAIETLIQDQDQWRKPGTEPWNPNPKSEQDQKDEDKGKGKLLDNWRKPGVNDNPNRLKSDREDLREWIQERMSDREKENINRDRKMREWIQEREDAFRKRIDALENKMRDREKRQDERQRRQDERQKKLDAWQQELATERQEFRGNIELRLNELRLKNQQFEEQVVETAKQALAIQEKATESQGRFRQDWRLFENRMSKRFDRIDGYYQSQDEYMRKSDADFTNRWDVREKRMELRFEKQEERSKRRAERLEKIASWPLWQNLSKWLRRLVFLAIVLGIWLGPVWFLNQPPTWPIPIVKRIFGFAKTTIEKAKAKKSGGSIDLESLTEEQRAALKKQLDEK